MDISKCTGGPSFDEEQARKEAIEMNHRGQIPPEMSSRWDAQGAFVAGQRVMFQKLQKPKQLNTVGSLYEAEKNDKALRMVAAMAKGEIFYGVLGPAERQSLQRVLDLAKGLK